jgi:integrase
MTNVSERIKKRDLPTDDEIAETLAKADKIKNPYFRLRVRALIALLKKFGKRRAEIGSLRISDLVMKEGFLFVTFTLRKKHKKGLFQYLKLLRKIDPQELNRPLSELEEQWRLWQLTEEGVRVREEKRTKKVSLEDKYAKLILEYLDFLTANHPEVSYLFPSGKAVFSRYYIDSSRPLSGRQLLRLIKPLNPTVAAPTASTIEEAKKLIESGFEYVSQIDEVRLYRKVK